MTRFSHFLAALPYRPWKCGHLIHLTHLTGAMGNATAKSAGTRTPGTTIGTMTRMTDAEPMSYAESQGKSYVPLLKALKANATSKQRDKHRAEWLRLRRNGIGASEIAAVLGKSPYASPFSLWYQKKEGWELEQTEAMYFGLQSEPMIAAEFTKRHPELKVFKPPATLYAHRDMPWVMCSPDLLAIDDRGNVIPVELKTDEGGTWGKQEDSLECVVPIQHAIQVLWQCGVFDAPYGYLVRYARKRYTDYMIPNTFGYRRELGVGLEFDWVHRAKDFLESVEADIPPVVDGHKATTETLLTVYSNVDPDAPPVPTPGKLVAEFERLSDLLPQVKHELEALQNQIRELMGAYGSTAKAMDEDGRVFVQRSVGKRSGYSVGPAIVDSLRRKNKRGKEDG